MPSVVAVNPLAGVAGGETNLLRLLPGLRARGWAVSATVPGAGRMEDALAEAGVDTARLALGPPQRRTVASYTGAVAARRRLRGRDVALLNGLSTQRTVWALRRLGTPAVLVVNNPLTEPPRAWADPKHWVTVRAVAAASHHVAEECRAAGAPSELVHSVYAAAWDGPEPPGAGAAPPAGLRVGFVGQIEPRKGVLELLEAAAAFLPRHPGATLTVVGEAPEPGGSYERRVRDAAAGIEGVKLTGFSPGAAAAMTDFDVVVVPSLAEPYGTVAAEAAAAGRPAVVSAVGGLTEVVRHGETGLHVAPGDPTALAAAVTALLGDPGRMRAMGAAALAAADRFSPGAYADAMDGLLRKALA